METLKKHLPFSGQEGLQELRKIAMRFEEKIYTAATSQSDYLRKISLKMLTMESKSQSNLPNGMASNSTSKSPQDPGKTSSFHWVPYCMYDWRSQLQPDSRQRIVNKIMETLKKHLPFSGQEGLQELRKIAMRFEEKIYTAATSQSDYLRKISLKMLTMESKSQSNLPNGMASNSTSKSPQDPASQNTQMQVQNQSQSLPTQPQPQARQQLLSHNMQNSIASGGMQNPVTFQSVSALTQNSIPNASQNPNLQQVTSISQNSMGSTLVQGVSSNMFANGQRQMQGRQQAQQVGVQQPVQNPQQYLYQQQLQQQMLTQKMQQGGIQQPPLQPQVQQQQQQQQTQQNLLQQSQLQPSQLSVMPTPSVMQTPMMSGIQQNQQSSIQQPSQSAIQQHQQSMLRQHQQPQQTSGIHQTQMQMPQQSMMSSQPQQQQQQLMGQQSSSAALHQNQLIGQQNSGSDMQHQQQQRLLATTNNLSSVPSQQNAHSGLQQQQLMGQQNNLTNIHQQQLGTHNHVGGLAQQQQLLGTQSGNPSMQSNQHQMHVMQQSKLPVQQHSQSASGFLPGGGVQQPQPQPQQQLISQVQSQVPQLQQQLGLQQQSNSLQQNMQQRLQQSGNLLQQRNMIDQQKQMFQSQRALAEAPTSSLDSTAQTGNQIDWQEEGYQKIKAMKEMYYTELNEIFQKISFKLQQHDSLPQQPKPEQLQKLRDFKQMLESLLQFLQLTKNSIPSRDKVAQYEKKIVSFLSTDRRKSASSLQQGQLPHMQSMQQFQQSHPQIPQPQSHDTGMNPQLQPLNMQNSTPNMQQTNMASLQQGSVSSLTALASSNLDSGQQNVSSSMQQINLGSLQQNPVNTSQQSNVSAVPLKSGVSLLQPSISALQPNSNILQNQHMKQQHEQQIMQSQQLKQQLQQRQIQQQLLRKQQLLQQQQLHQQTKQQQQQHGQMQPHQMSQVQISDTNDIKIRQAMGLKPGVLPHHLQQGQRYPLQQVKPSGTFPNSPQLLQTASPQMNQHSSPQIDQQSMLPPLNKLGTPSQSANSPFVVPSPQTPLAPSPMPGEPEKPSTALSSLSNAANVGHQQAIGASLSALSLSIGTPGISASPLLAEFTMPDGTHGSVSTISGKPGITELPLQRLMKAVSSLSPKELNETVSDIGSIISMIDRIAGSAPGNGSRAAVGEDLVAMTKCRLQARNFVTQEGSSGAKRMRRYTSTMPINVASPLNGMNGSFKQFTASDTSELESTATSNIKRLQTEANHALLEEIREVNERLIDTVVDINDEDINPTMPVGASECGEGTIVKCSFVAVALSPDLKAQYASQMSPIQPLRMLVPANYPNSSPILLDKFPLEASEYDDLSLKAKSRFRISLRTLSQPMSLKDIARAWDDCTRAVLSEYAQQSGGGTFSLKFGLWKNCLTAA
ncbi:hypothetical protein Droror1_Dr00015135 [Drosera rotundifolia]